MNARLSFVALIALLCFVPTEQRRTHHNHNHHHRHHNDAASSSCADAKQSVANCLTEKSGQTTFATGTESVNVSPAEMQANCRTLCTACVNFDNMASSCNQAFAQSDIQQKAIDKCVSKCVAGNLRRAKHHWQHLFRRYL